MKHAADRGAADRELLGEPMLVQNGSRRQPPRVDIGSHGLIQDRREREFLVEFRFSGIHAGGSWANTDFCAHFHGAKPSMEVRAASRERIFEPVGIVQESKTDLKPDFLVCVQKTALLV